MDWPRPNERLFVSGADWEHNACINCYSESFTGYAWYYKTAADELVRSAMENRGILDVIINPIGFLYRQYVELALKEIVVLCNRLEQHSVPAPLHHNLNSLWSEAKRLLSAQYGANVPAEIRHLDQVVDEFSRFDPTSVAFRYPWDKNGRPSLQGLSHINVRNLYETMERVASFLDCMATDLDQRRLSAHFDSQ